MPKIISVIYPLFFVIQSTVEQEATKAILDKISRTNVAEISMHDSVICIHSSLSVLSDGEVKDILNNLPSEKFVSFNCAKNIEDHEFGVQRMISFELSRQSAFLSDKKLNLLKKSVYIIENSKENLRTLSNLKPQMDSQIYLASRDQSLKQLMVEEFYCIKDDCIQRFVMGWSGDDDVPSPEPRFIWERRSDLKGLKVKANYLEAPPFVNTKDNQLTGYYVEVLRIVAHDLNVMLEFSEAKDLTYGVEDDFGNFNGAVGEVIKTYLASKPRSIDFGQKSKLYSCCCINQYLSAIPSKRASKSLRMEQEAKFMYAYM